MLVAMLEALARIGVVLESHTLNGQPGAVVRDPQGRVLNTFTLDVLDGRLQIIRSVLNPDKLRHMSPVADVWEVMREVNRARRGVA